MNQALYKVLQTNRVDVVLAAMLCEIADEDNFDFDKHWMLVKKEKENQITNVLVDCKLAEPISSTHLRVDLTKKVPDTHVCSAFECLGIAIPKYKEPKINNLSIAMENH